MSTTASPLTASSPSPGTAGRTPQRLSHLALVTHDAEATTAFYTEVMRMPLVAAVMHERVPSTGDLMPYLHIFFRMHDGSTIAFFEAPALPARAPKTHPAYDVFEHIALEVSSVAEVDEWKAWVESKGVAVVGPVDHTIIYSIYFFDPNGIRLEITTPLVDDWNDRPLQARAAVDAWTSTKARANDEGRDVIDALHDLIRTSDPTTFD